MELRSFTKILCGLLLGAGLSLLLTGCAKDAKEPPRGESIALTGDRPAVPVPEPATAQPAAAARSFEILARASEIRILVYREGRLAALGHNHVISTQEVRGRLVLTPGIRASTLELEIPVTSLVVDDPVLREKSGEAFDTEPSPEDIAGTRRNMLGERVLDAANHPTIALSARAVSASLPELELEVELRVRSATLRFRTEARVETRENRLIARGQFTLSHSQLGLEPFSVLGGALSVSNEMTIHYRLVAEAEQ